MIDSTWKQLLAKILALQQQSVISGADRIKLWRNVVKLAEAPYSEAQAFVAPYLVDMQQALSQAQAAKDNLTLTEELRRRVFRNLHDLAQANYQPAFEFLLTCLDHPDSTWRLQSLRSIGFHYATAPDSLFLKKARMLLLHDPDSDVRCAAALILGIHSQWQDLALVAALTYDPQAPVRAVAFASLLELAGVPRALAWTYWQQVKRGEIQPTWEQVQRSLEHEGIDSNSTKLSRRQQTKTKFEW